MSNTFIHLSLLAVVFLVLYTALHFALASHPLFEGKKKFLWILPLLLLSFVILKIGVIIGEKIQPEISEVYDPTQEDTTNIADTNKPTPAPQPQPKITPKPDSNAKGRAKPAPVVVTPPKGGQTTPIAGGGGSIAGPGVVTPTPVKPPVNPAPIDPTDDELPVKKGEMNTGIKKK